MTLISSCLLLIAIPLVTGNNNLLCDSTRWRGVETFINAHRLKMDYNLTSQMTMGRCIDTTKCSVSNCNGDSLLEIFFVKDIMEHEYIDDAYPLYFTVTGRFEGTPKSDSSFGIVMMNGTVYENVVKFSSSGLFEGVSIKSDVFRKHRLCEQDAITFDDGSPVDISFNEDITLTIEFKSATDSVYYFYINKKLFGAYLFDADDAKSVEGIGFAVKSDATFIASNIYLLHEAGFDVELPNYNSKGEPVEYTFNYEYENDYNYLIPILCSMLILSMVIHVICCYINYRNKKKTDPKSTSLAV